MADEKEDSEPERITHWNPENIDRMPGRRLPSVFANQYFVLLRENTMRIVFGEAVVGEDDANWFTSVTFEREKALDLAKTIIGIFEGETESTPKPENPYGTSKK